MRKLLVVVAVAACGPADRAPEAPDANTLPPGVWEPDPGAGRVLPLAAASADGVWFAYRRTGSPAGLYDGWWLTKTTADGQPIVSPVQADRDATFPFVAIAASDSSVTLAAAKGGDRSALVARFDQAGHESSDRVMLGFGDDRLFGPILLAARPSGETKLVLAGDVHEIVIVDVDGGTAPTTIGTRDNSSSWSIGAAFEPGGELAVGWDRTYDRCFQYVPYSALATVVHDGVVDPPRLARDMPNHSEYVPAVSPSFMVWQQDDDLTGLSSTLVVAALADLDTAYEIGVPNAYNGGPMIAEESPGHAAIAWQTEHARPQIAALVRDADGIRIGVRHELPRVDEQADMRIDALVSAGTGRYVVVWTETGDPHAGYLPRVYATTFDLSQDPAPRLAPPARTVASTQRGMPRVVPCSH